MTISESDGQPEFQIKIFDDGYDPETIVDNSLKELWNRFLEKNCKIKTR